MMQCLAALNAVPCSPAADNTVGAAGDADDDEALCPAGDDDDDEALCAAGDDDDDEALCAAGDDDDDEALCAAGDDDDDARCPCEATPACCGATWIPSAILNLRICSSRCSCVYFSAQTRSACATSARKTAWSSAVLSLTRMVLKRGCKI